MCSDCLESVLVYITGAFDCLFYGADAPFNNISVISWRSVCSVEETRRPGKNQRPVASHWQTLSHNVAHLPWSIFELTTSAVIENDCKGNNNNQYWCLWPELCHYRPLRYLVVFLTYDMLNVMPDVKYYTYNILTYTYYWNIIYKMLYPYIIDYLYNCFIHWAMVCSYILDNL